MILQSFDIIFFINYKPTGSIYGVLADLISVNAYELEMLISGTGGSGEEKRLLSQLQFCTENIVYHLSDIMVNINATKRILSQLQFCTENIVYHLSDIMVKNKTNHPISSNSHPFATTNKAIHFFKWGGGGLQNQREQHIILTMIEEVQPTVVSENYSSSGMLTILIKVQRVSILSNILLANSHILYLKGQNNVR